MRLIVGAAFVLAMFGLPGRHLVRSGQFLPDLIVDPLLAVPGGGLVVAMVSYGIVFLSFAFLGWLAWWSIHHFDLGLNRYLAEASSRRGLVALDRLTLILIPAIGGGSLLLGWVGVEDLVPFAVAWLALVFPMAPGKDPLTPLLPPLPFPFSPDDPESKPPDSPLPVEPHGDPEEEDEADDSDDGEDWRRVLRWSFEPTGDTFPASIDLNQEVSIAPGVYQELHGRRRELDPRVWYREYVVEGITAEVRALARGLRGEAEVRAFSQVDEAACSLAMVQSIPYMLDETSTGQAEYPKYPVETLFDFAGDCEDSSILAAAVLKTLGYDVVLLLVPGHIALGLAGAEGIHGTFISHEGRRYFYCETTGSGWRIGEIPSDLAEEPVEVIA